MSSRFVGRLFAWALAYLLQTNAATAADWKAVDALIDQGQFNPAKAELAKIIKEKKSDHDWASALAKITGILETEGKFEEAVEFINNAERPTRRSSRALVDLYAAKAMFTYMDAYAWEIRQREQQSLSAGKKPLRSMTQTELYATALRSYDEAWAAREELGQQKISEYKNLIQPNTFPNGLRGTLRDVVSYKAIEALENSSYWQPAESNSLYTIPVDKILTGDLNDLGITKDISLADSQYHPLLRLTYVAENLANWNRAKGNDEGALEAKIALHRSLHDLLQSDDDKKKVRQSLTNLLTKNKKVSWVASGYGHLASMHLSIDEPITAHKIATLCLASYENHTELCKSTKDTIEQSTLYVSAMEVDGLNKRSLRVQHRNLQTVWFRAYKLDLMDRIAEQANTKLIPDHQEFEKLRTKKADFNWQVKLPVTTDFRQHDTYVTPPFKAPGLYAIIASAKEDFSLKNNLISAFPFSVSNLVILTEAVTNKAGETVVSIVEGENGKPVPGATVTLFSHTPYAQKNIRKKISEGSTDATGRVKLTGPKDHHELLLIAKNGSDVSVRVNPEVGYNSNNTTDKHSLIFTDRGAYRPGQKVQWKVVTFTKTQGSSDVRIAPNQKFKVSLHDINSQQVQSKTVTSNAFGSASGEFIIPEGHALGQWYLTTSHGHSNHQISVEEYKRPTFEVTFQELKDQYRVNQKAEVSGSARYHFGAPLTEGKVIYKVERQARYPSWMSFIFWRQPASMRSEIVASGEVKVSPDGSFRIAFVPKAKEATSPFEMTTTYNYNISADVTDNGGETRSQSTSLIAGHVTIQADLNEVSSVCFDSTACTMRINRQTLNGTGAEGTGQIELVALVPPRNTLAPAEIPLELSPQNSSSSEERTPTPGDSLKPRWDSSFSLETYLGSWTPGKQVAKATVKHGKNGQGAFKPETLEAGAYKLIYSTKDNEGREYQVWKYFIVAKSGETNLKLPAFIAADAVTQDIGKSVRLFVHNGTSVKQLIRLYRHQRTFREISVAPGSHIISIPVTADLYGGFTAALQTVFDYQHIRVSENIFVPWSDRSLDVSFERLRDIMRPGTKESFTIRVKGADAGNRIAEVLAFMYDKSLDAIQPNNVQNPLSLFPNTTGTPHIGSNLGEASSTFLQAEGFTGPKNFDPPATDFLLDLNSSLSSGPTRNRRGYAGNAMRKKSRGLSLSADSMMTTGDQSNESVTAMAELAPTQPAPAAAGNIAPVPSLRENFAETVFFIPHMTTKADGTVTATFNLPDSLTTWQVRAVALMKNFASGTASKEIRTAKDLMTRLYVPRFVREGDEVTFRVTINNMSKSTLNGPLKVSVRDADTNADLGKDWNLVLDRTSFSVPAEGSLAINATVKVPAGGRTIKIESQASAGSFSDGEIQTLPVLPGRMHLIQSRFTALQPGATETVTFDDLKDTSDTSRINEKMTVTVDAQLFFSTLKALPYLVLYPYEGSEQTLNRFLSASIISAIFEENPELKNSAAKFATRAQQLEPWTRNDPNQRMQLEESPWLQDATGGKNDDLQLINLLKPQTTNSIKKKALSDLQKMQTSSGGFPWFPGGAPSPYMTLYIVYGFAKAQEFGISVPDDMAKNAWKYLGDHFKALWARQDSETEQHIELLTFLNFTASAFQNKNVLANHIKDEDRKRILGYSMQRWKKLPPYLQLMLSLTAYRMNEKKDADMILASILDRAKITKDGGTSWAMEDRSWLWYNDSTEMHAFALRALSEMRKDSKLIPGIIHWIFLNKKLNQWKSTKATAEVIYSIASYLKTTGTTSADERIHVTVGATKKEFNFRKDEYTGRQFLTVDGPEISPASANITAKSASSSIAFVSTTWRYSTELLPKNNSGDFFEIDRKYFIRKANGGQMTLKPLEAGEHIAIGDELEVRISIKNKHPAEYIHLRDPRPSGFEPTSTSSGYKWDLGISWYEEVRDNGTNFFFDWLPSGEYTFKYRLRAANAGIFKSMPAEIQSLYAPEFNAFSSGQTVTISN